MKHSLLPKIDFTAAGYQKLLDDQAKLLAERPIVVDNLQKAREMGDLSENGYYKESKARLGFLDSRLRRLERLIKFGEVVAKTATNQVAINSRVTLTDGAQEYQYTLVGGYESDPDKNLISPFSPLGKALMDRQVNDLVSVITPKGKKEYKIKCIA